MKALILRKTYYLTKGQFNLYQLICEKLKANNPITFDDAKDIFVSKVARDVDKGIVYWENYRLVDGKTEYFREPMNKWAFKARVGQWLVISIGALVMKGALKVIPAINL